MSQTPQQIVVGNMDRFLADWRGMAQDKLALRMRSMGFRWHRRTVFEVLRGRRRINIDELYGLALALETTVGALLSPLIGVDFPDRPKGTCQIGTGIDPLDPLIFDRLRKLPDMAMYHGDLALTGWPVDDDDESVPTWKRPPSDGLRDLLLAALSQNEWGDEAGILHTQAGESVLNELGESLQAQWKEEGSAGQ